MTTNRISEWSDHCLTGTGSSARNKPAPVSVVLLAIAGILGVLAVAKVAGFYIASTGAQRIVRQAIDWSKPDANTVETQVAKFKPIAEDLKKKNLFCPSPPKEHPVKAVLGIFGDEAYINGKWYKVGAKIGDAKIVVIDAASVTIEWDGKKTVFLPIDADVPPAPGGPKPRPEGPARRPGPPEAERPNRVAARPGPPPMPGPGR